MANRAIRFFAGHGCARKYAANMTIGATNRYLAAKIKNVVARSCIVPLIAYAPVILRDAMADDSREVHERSAGEPPAGIVSMIGLGQDAVRVLSTRCRCGEHLRRPLLLDLAVVTWALPRYQREGRHCMRRPPIGSAVALPSR